MPELIQYFKERDWTVPNSIDRVYVIDKAKEMLGYVPRYNIREFLEEEMKDN